MSPWVSPWEPPPAPARPVAELVEQAEMLWQQGGNAGLVRAWPEVLAQLQARPEAARADDAVPFAQWFVASHSLPAPVRRSLQQHFGWQRDYRLAHQLGDELAEALQERLTDLDDEPSTTASKHPLTALQALWQTPGQRAQALWIAVCGRPLWLRLQSQLNDHRKLRLNTRQAFGLRLLLLLAGLPRLALLGLALVVPAMVMIGGAGAPFLPLVVLVWPVHALLRGVQWLGGAVLLWDLSLLGGGGADEEAWRLQPVRLGLTLALLAGAVLLAAQPSEGRSGEIAHGLAVMALGASVFIVRWTQTLMRSPAVVGCFVAAWLLCRWGSGQALGAVGPAALAAAWVLLGTAAYESRLGSALASRVMAVCTWPVSRTLALADRWGWRATYWPSASVAVMAAGATATEQSPPLACALALLWAAWTTGLVALQDRLDSSARAALTPPSKDKW
jgi:hypothetical protein